MTLNKFITIVAVFVRAVLCYRFFSLSIGPAVLFGASEIFALLMTVLSLACNMYSVDRRSALVPLLYITPLALYPSGAGFRFAGLLLAFFACFQIVLRFYMGQRVTVGTPNFHSLLSTGPWSYCRHPLAATEMLICALFVARYFTAWNLVAGLVAICSIFCATMIEEAFLNRFCVYRRYSRRVRFRFLPLSC